MLEVLMFCFKDMTFCPEEIAQTCTKGNTCDRAWNALLQQQADAWMKNPPVCFFAETPSCLSLPPVEEKYHKIMAKVHRCLDRWKFKGTKPNYFRVKHLAKCGFSVFEIIQECIRMHKEKEEEKTCGK
jgi:hypothetical protein